MQVYCFFLGSLAHGYYSGYFVLCFCQEDAYRMCGRSCQLKKQTVLPKTFFCLFIILQQNWDLLDSPWLRKHLEKPYGEPDHLFTPQLEKPNAEPSPGRTRSLLSSWRSDRDIIDFHWCCSEENDVDMITERWQTFRHLGNVMLPKDVPREDA